MTVQELKPFKPRAAEEIAADDRRRLARLNDLETDIHEIRCLSHAAHTLYDEATHSERLTDDILLLNNMLRDKIEGLYAKYHAKD